MASAARIIAAVKRPGVDLRGSLGRAETLGDGNIVREPDESPAAAGPRAGIAAVGIEAPAPPTSRTMSAVAAICARDPGSCARDGVIAVKMPTTSHRGNSRRIGSVGGVYGVVLGDAPGLQQPAYGCRSWPCRSTPCLRSIRPLDRSFVFTRGLLLLSGFTKHCCFSDTGPVRAKNVSLAGVRETFTKADLCWSAIGGVEPAAGQVR
jgi:hypothetical protein